MKINDTRKTKYSVSTEDTTSHNLPLQHRSAPYSDDAKKQVHVQAQEKKMSMSTSEMQHAKVVSLDKVASSSSSHLTSNQRNGKHGLRRSSLFNIKFKYQKELIKS